MFVSRLCPRRWGLSVYFVSKLALNGQEDHQSLAKENKQIATPGTTAVVGVGRIGLHFFRSGDCALYGYSCGSR